MWAELIGLHVHTPDTFMCMNASVLSKDNVVSAAFFRG